MSDTLSRRPSACHYVLRFPKLLDHNFASRSFDTSITSLPNCLPAFMSSNNESMPSMLSSPPLTDRETIGFRFFSWTNLTMSANSLRDPIVDPRTSMFLRTAAIWKGMVGEVVMP